MSFKTMQPTIYHYVFVQLLILFTYKDGSLSRPVCPRIQPGPSCKEGGHSTDWVNQFNHIKFSSTKTMACKCNWKITWVAIYAQENCTLHAILKCIKFYRLQCIWKKLEKIMIKELHGNTVKMCTLLILQNCFLVIKHLVAATQSLVLIHKFNSCPTNNL